MTKNKEMLFGLHAVTAVLEESPERVFELFVLKERQDKKVLPLLSLAKSAGIAVQLMGKKELDKLAENGNHQGVVAFCKAAMLYSEQDIERLLAKCENTPFILILDGVQDPHNLGACLRTADGANVDMVIIPKDKAVGITPIVSKVASGAVNHVAIVSVTNLARTLAQLQELGVWLYGAAGEAKESLYQLDLTGPIGLVLGAEGSGLRRLTRDTCDHLYHIPMLGSVSSLNVSVAAGVSLYEVVRQRLSLQKKKL